jgi:hypothetical protein
MSNGVDLVLARMESHPEEFYTSANDKWKFIYSDYFRDAMTETEKGMIFDKIKEIRKAEFTSKVMVTLTAGMQMGKKSKQDNFGNAIMKSENELVDYNE